MVVSIESREEIRFFEGRAAGEFGKKFFCAKVVWCSVRVSVPN